MSRSKWKTPLTNLNFNKLVKELNKNNQIKRSAKITPLYLNQTFKIHNGKSFLELQVTENMMGHKFGEFAFTRSKYVYKKKKRKKRRILITKMKKKK
jgi:small subunit ribosomal protein S19